MSFTTKKKLILFMPHLSIGGVEKNLFILSNFLITKIKNISIITTNKEIKNKLDKRIKIISLKTNLFNNSHVYIKYTICVFL